MEKNNKYFLVLLLFISASFKGQTSYFKLLDQNDTYWYVSQMIFAVKSANQNSNVNVTEGKYMAQGDTSLGGKTYKKFYRVFCPPLFPYPTTYEGAIREDTIAKKVFFFSNSESSERLLYDFSLNIGDSAYFNFSGPIGTFPTGYYKLVNKQPFTTPTGTYTKFNLRKKISSTSYSDTLTYLEGVGSIHHPIYLYGSGYYLSNMLYTNPAPCVFNSAFMQSNLSCKLKSVNLEFKSCVNYIPSMSNFLNITSINDSCQRQFVLGSGLAEQLKEKSFNLYFNSDEKVMVFSNNRNNEIINPGVISIIDLTGKICKKHISEKGVSEFIIPVSDLLPGCYIFNYTSDKDIFRKPLIINN